MLDLAWRELNALGEKNGRDAFTDIYNYANEEDTYLLWREYGDYITNPYVRYTVNRNSDDQYLLLWAYTFWGRRSNDGTSAMWRILLDQILDVYPNELYPAETVRSQTRNIARAKERATEFIDWYKANYWSFKELKAAKYDDEGKLVKLDRDELGKYVHALKQSNYLTPDLLKSLKKRQQEDQKKQALLQELKGKPNTTLDGKTINVFANIGGMGDVGAVQQNDAGGVGLFRTEFVYLNCKDFPTEDYQFEAYKQVLESLAPRKVVVRTCDIGADKTVDYMKLDHEDNPALGYRAIRICLTRKDFFKTQLRALLRASAYGNMSIMFPMITSLRELQDAKAVLDECRAELRAEGKKFDEKMEVGTMIETPAAVFIADELAAECDFFSIGTNDLTQYTCALDRQNAKLEPFFNPHHPAVLRAIKMTIEAGHRHGIWVGICGELGADTALTETFLRMGVDELSMNAKSILPVRKIIRSVDLSKPSEKA